MKIDRSCVTTVAGTAPEPPAPAQEGDAGDMLEAERHHLASHPTEHYDVDAAIAEEDEIDILSESSLSDELDRALESLSAGPRTTPELASEVLALRGNPSAAAAAVFALLGDDDRFRVDAAGVWSLEAPCSRAAEVSVPLKPESGV